MHVVYVARKQAKYLIGQCALLEINQLYEGRGFLTACGMRFHRHHVAQYNKEMRLARTTEEQLDRMRKTGDRNPWQGSVALKRGPKGSSPARVSSLQAA
jgi:hypothetical protein